MIQEEKEGLKHTTTDKMRLAKHFSVSIGSWQCLNNCYTPLQNIGHKQTTEKGSVVVQTSTEHETEILPTTMSREDGSNKSNTSTSESESCKILSFKSKKNKSKQQIRFCQQK